MIYVCAGVGNRNWIGGLNTSNNEFAGFNTSPFNCVYKIGLKYILDIHNNNNRIEIASKIDNKSTYEYEPKP